MIDPGQIGFPSTVLLLSDSRRGLTENLTQYKMCLNLVIHFFRTANWGRSLTQGGEVLMKSFANRRRLASNTKKKR